MDFEIEEIRREKAEIEMGELAIAEEAQRETESMKENCSLESGRSTCSD